MNKSSKHPTYESNPVTLLIEAARRAFTSSQTVALFLILIPLGLSIVQYIFQAFSQVFTGSLDSTSSHSPASAASIIVGSILGIFALLLVIFLGVVWSGFAAKAGLDIMERKNDTFSGLFGAAMDKFFKVFGAKFMVGLYTLPWWIAGATMVVSAIVSGIAGGVVAIVLVPLSVIAALFFLFMAVRVTFRYGLTLYALFDGKDGVFAALEESKDLTKGRLIEVFGIVSLSGIVPFISTLLSSGGAAILYQQLKEHRNSKESLPKPHILNYLVLFFIGGLILIIALIALLIFIVARSNA